MVHNSRNPLEQVIGLSIALIILFLVTEQIWLILLAAGLLFGGILRVPFVFVTADFFGNFLRQVGGAIVTIVLGAVYILFLVPYSLIFKATHRKELHSFLGKSSGKSSFRNVERVYDKSFFHKTW